MICVICVGSLMILVVVFVIYAVSLTVMVVSVRCVVNLIATSLAVAILVGLTGVIVVIRMRVKMKVL